MRTKRTSSVPSRSYIVRSDTYKELKTGDRVRVVGETGNWTFKHYCVNTDTGSDWLDVFGGTPGAETLRAFKAERVVPANRTRGARRPVAPPPELTLEDLI